MAAYDYITEHHNLNREQKAFLKNNTFPGNEIVAGTRRLCLMNMFLHNIGEIDGGTFISLNDALIADEGIRVDYVLANPLRRDYCPRQNQPGYLLAQRQKPGRSG